MQSEVNEDHRVIIRCWRSIFTEGESFGHISIETTNPKKHISLYPKGVNETDLKTVFKKYPPDYKASYLDDYRAENNRKPEEVICLYSLNNDQIAKKFEALKKDTNLKWTLLGSGILFNITDENCASFVYKLLKAGGISQLMHQSIDSKNSYNITVSPSTLLEGLKEAKKRELELYPWTKKIVFDEENEICSDNESCCTLC